MKFEQNLVQKHAQTQKLIMTQQLKQSIQILQYSTEELLNFLDEQMLENPLLEVAIKEDPRDYLSNNLTAISADDKTKILNQLPNEGYSLFQHLIEQIHLNYRDTPIRKCSLFLAEYIDLNGYLTISLEEAKELSEYTSIELLDALTLIQLLEPTGVGARNLRECLMLQVEKDDEAPNLAYIIIEEMFEELAIKKWQKIEKKYSISLGEIQLVFDYIQTLNPSPGAIFSNQKENYVVPDLKLTMDTVTKKLRVSSLKAYQPEVKFQQAYFDKMSRADDKEVQDYLDKKKKDFEALKKSVDQRGDTILRVGQEIINRQAQFFTTEPGVLRPMQMKTIAKTIGVHESTISRSVNEKYIETVDGIFELKHFFSNGLAQSGTKDEVSSHTIKQDIEFLISEEDKEKPLSDQKIADYFKGKSISISRRTVAKYREELGIESSTKRKRYNN